MSNKYLIRRGAIWYFRIAIPLNLRQAWCRNEIIKSLHTSCKKEAVVYSRILEGAAHQLFMIPLQGKEISKEELNVFIRNYFAECLELHKQIEQQLPAKNSYKILNEAKETMLATLNRITDSNIYKDKELKVSKIKSVIEKQTSVNHRFHIMNAMPPFPQEAHESQRKCFFGIIYNFPDDENSPESIKKIQNYILDKNDVDYENDIKNTHAEHILQNHIKSATKQLSILHDAYFNGSEPCSNDTLFKDMVEDYASGEEPYKISELYEKFLSEIKKAPATIVKKKASFNIFIGLMGDVTVKRFAKKDARKFKEALMRLPSHIKQRYADKELSDLITLDISKEDRMATNTINNYISDLRNFFKWCQDNGYYPDSIPNPFERLALPKEESDPRKSLTPEQITTFFSCPIYTGCSSFTRRYEAGTRIYKDSLYWIPLLSLFTGMRISEITELYVDDIIKDKKLTSIILM